MVQHVFACQLTNQLGNIAQGLHLSESTVALQSCVTLPLECGCALMASVLSGSNSAGSAADCVFLEQQITLLHNLFAYSGRDDTVDLLAAKLTPPEPLLAWLSSTADMLLITLQGTWHGSGKCEGSECAAVEMLVSTWPACSESLLIALLFGSPHALFHCRFFTSDPGLLYPDH
jgi:hypothetical protein